MLEGRKVADLVGNEFVNAIFTAQFQIDINHSLPPKPLALPTCARVSSLWGELSLDLCWLSPDNENILFSIKQSGMFPGSVPRLPRAVVTFAVTKWLRLLSANNEPWEAKHEQLLCRVHTASTVIAVFQPLSVSGSQHFINQNQMCLTFVVRAFFK